MANIDTILFDCDNTLVQSEDLAFAGCADLVNGIVRELGLPVGPFTGPSLQSTYVGQNFRGMLSTLSKQFGVDITPEAMDGYVRQEEDVTIAKFEEALQACEGANDELAKLEKQGKYTLAVVSSSALRRVNISLAKTGQTSFFGDRVYSAANSMPEPTTKPDPAIYLFSMVQLGKTADQCVAVEDSRSGTLSATRAKIRTIGYVGAYPAHERETMAKALQDAGAQVIMYAWSDLETCLDQISKV